MKLDIVGKYISNDPKAKFFVAKQLGSGSAAEVVLLENVSRGMGGSSSVEASIKKLFTVLGSNKTFQAPISTVFYKATDSVLVTLESDAVECPVPENYFEYAQDAFSAASDLLANGFTFESSDNNKFTVSRGKLLIRFSDGYKSETALSETSARSHGLIRSTVMALLRMARPHARTEETLADEIGQFREECNPGLLFFVTWMERILSSRPEAITLPALRDAAFRMTRHFISTYSFEGIDGPTKEISGVLRNRFIANKARSNGSAYIIVTLSSLKTRIQTKEDQIKEIMHLYKFNAINNRLPRLIHATNPGDSFLAPLDMIDREMSILVFENIQPLKKGKCKSVKNLSEFATSLFEFIAKSDIGWGDIESLSIHNVAYKKNKLYYLPYVPAKPGELSSGAITRKDKLMLEALDLIRTVSKKCGLPEPFPADLLKAFGGDKELNRFMMDKNSALTPRDIFVNMSSSAEKTLGQK